MGEKLTAKSKLYGWNNPTRPDYVYPQPYAEIALARHKYTDPGLGTRDVNPIPGLINAAVSLACEELQAERSLTPPALPHSHLAMGTMTTKDGKEAIFTEYAGPLSPASIQFAMYDATLSKDQLRGGVYSMADNLISPLKYDGTAKDYHSGKVTLCEAAWLALLAYARTYDTDSMVTKAYNAIKEDVAAYYMTGQTVKAEDASFTNGVIALSWIIYRNLSLTGNIPLSGSSDNQAKSIRKDAIESGSIAPAKGKSLLPNKYVVFKEERTRPSAAPEISIDEIASSVPFQRKLCDFTEAEKALIPSVDPKEILSSSITGIIKEIARTWKKDPDLRASRILLEGGAGSGKTYTVRSIAAHLGRPYVTHICGNTDGPDAFQGTIIPYIKGDDGKKHALMSKEQFYKIASNPALTKDWIEDFAMDISFDPNTAEKRKSDLAGFIQNTAALLEEGSLSEREKENLGVQYEYIPSAVVEAVKNGYLLEIQERATRSLLKRQRTN